MEHIGIHEAKTNLSKLLKRLALGEEFAITNRGKIVALLKAPKPTERQAQMRVVLEGMAELAQNNKPCRMDEIQQWRKMGQKP